MKCLILLLIGLFNLAVYGADWTGVLMNSMNDPTLLSGIILNSGKGINDLGDYDSCEKNDNLHHAVFQIKGGFFAAYIGLWVPVEWKEKDLQIVADALKNLINEPSTNVYVQIPSSTDKEVSVGNAIGFAFFSFIVVLSAIGIITEYTNLFDKPNAINPSVEKRKSKLGLVFLSFSFTRNISKIFWGPKQKPDDYLTVFNGLRVISLLVVMFGHGYSSILESPVSEIYGIQRIIEPWSFAFIPGGFFAVDIFFFLSAFLGAYLMLEKFFQKRSMSFLLIYFHRVYRIVIPVSLVIALFMTFYIYLGNGPVWNYVSEAWLEGWKKQWYHAVLLVSNLFPWNYNSKWIGWLWYIPNDMQFFLFLPFQIFLYKRHRYLGYGLTYFILFAGWLSSFIISAINESNVSLISDTNYWNVHYVRPWTRIAAYEVGVIFGMWYYEWMNRDKSHLFANSFGTRIYQLVGNFKAIRYPLYFISIFIILMLVFIQHSEGRNVLEKKQVLPQFIKNLFNAFARPLFVLGIIGIFMGPLTGKGSLIRYVLGSQEWNPWAKLSFMVYLIHLLVFGLYYNQIRQSVELFNKQIVFAMFACMFVAYTIAIPLSALLEAPFMNIEKFLLFPSSDRKPKLKEAINDEFSENSLDDVKKKNRY